MQKHDLKTQIFYLNRIFKILSDGYNPSGIIFNPNWLSYGPVGEIKEEQKLVVVAKDLNELLEKIFSELYEHNKLFTDAPKVFNQDWNNEFVLETIQETKTNILDYLSDKKMIKTFCTLHEDDAQVIEFLNGNQQNECILFMTEIH